MAAPKKTYQPRMTDPVSGRKLQKGRAVPAASAAPAPSVRDPYTGDRMQKGRPVPTAYSGALNQRVGQGIAAGLGAVQAAFKPAYLGAKGRVPSPTPAPVAPARAPRAPTAAASPAASVPTMDSVSRAKPNSPGYEDFPNSLSPGKKRKKNGY